MSPNFASSSVIVPLNENIEKLAGNLIGKVSVICGPTGAGKTSAAIWANRNSPGV